MKHCSLSNETDTSKTNGLHLANQLWGVKCSSTHVDGLRDALPGELRLEERAFCKEKDDEQDFSIPPPSQACFHPCDETAQGGRA